jgi:hypothetical protein
MGQPTMEELRARAAKVAAGAEVADARLARIAVARKNNPEVEVSTNELRAGCVRTLDMARQLRADIAAWNEAHPLEEPIDVDPDGELAWSEEEAKRILRVLPAGEVFQAPARNAKEGR